MGGIPAISERLESMKKPIPGVDPYLEAFWGDYPNRPDGPTFAIKLRVKLPGDLQATYRESVKCPTNEVVTWIFPDVKVRAENVSRHGGFSVAPTSPLRSAVLVPVPNENAGTSSYRDRRTGIENRV